MKKDNNSISEAARLMGQRGGKKTAKRGKGFYSQIGKKGMANRWGKKADLTEEMEKLKTALDKT